jgi:hypothetical protein
MLNKPSPLEIAAEEFLNGLLCHYEPPQNPYLDEARDTEYQDPLELRRPPSILKTSKSFEEKKTKSKKGRSVRFQGVSFKDSSNKQRHNRTNLFKRITFRGRKVEI